MLQAPNIDPSRPETSAVDVHDPPATAASRSGRGITTASPARSAEARSAESRPEPVPRIPLQVAVAALDFGACPFGSRRRVETIGSRAVAVVNASDAAVPCAWVVPSGPFVVTPSTTIIEPRTTTTFQVHATLLRP